MARFVAAAYAANHVVCLVLLLLLLLVAGAGGHAHRAHDKPPGPGAPEPGAVCVCPRLRIHIVSSRLIPRKEQGFCIASMPGSKILFLFLFLFLSAVSFKQCSSTREVNLTSS